MAGVEPVEALVIGAGPAGLAAAEALVAAGLRPVITDAMPSPARKLLMAGKSGLNLTRAGTADAIAGQIRWGAGGDFPPTAAMLAAASPAMIRDWAERLGVAMFTGSTGRVFPVAMKASPLLRAWLARLQSGGAILRQRWRWVGLADGVMAFDTPEGPRRIAPGVTVLALGGASWSRLGSDGGWVAMLAAAGVGIAPFRPANMGFVVDWSPYMARHVGQPVKGSLIRAGGQISRGEWVITRRGIEGGGIYALAAAIRDGARPVLDLAPDLDVARLAARLDKVPARQSRGNRLRRALGDPLRAALALEWGGPASTGDNAALARHLKRLPMPLGAPMDLAGAISSAGGIRADSLGPDLSLVALPGVFAAGEMLDWEAPTGGYLLTMCLASGRWAGRAAAAASAMLPGRDL